MSKVLRAFALMGALGAVSPAFAEDSDYSDEIDPRILNSMQFEGITLGQPRDEIVMDVMENMTANQSAVTEVLENGTEISVLESPIKGDIPVVQMSYELPDGTRIIENFDRYDAYLNHNDPSWGAAQDAFLQAQAAFQEIPCTDIEIDWFKASIYSNDQAETQLLIDAMCDGLEYSS